MEVLKFALLVALLLVLGGPKKVTAFSSYSSFATVVTTIAAGASVVVARRVPSDDNASAALTRDSSNKRGRRLMSSSSTSSTSSTRSKGSKGSKGSSSPRKFAITIKNLTGGQPFSPFFVMVHNDNIERLFERGMEPSPALADLAENGSPASLVALYAGQEGVLSAFGTQDGPTIPGNPTTIEVVAHDSYPYVTIAAMAVNTNDCFISAESMLLEDGAIETLPGLDAGSEENNELCPSIPGPACPADSGNVRSLNGEGVVHVHRGVFGTGDLSADQYDWRNPIAAIEILELNSNI